MFWGLSFVLYLNVFMRLLGANKNKLIADIMKRLFLLAVCSLLFLSAQGQKNTQELTELVFIDENAKTTLDSLIFHQKEGEDRSGFDYFKYFRLYVNSTDNGTILEFLHSHIPYKSTDLLGFFALMNYLVFVYRELPDFLAPTANKRTFTYWQEKIIFEDKEIDYFSEDATGWIVIKYEKPSFKL